MNDEAARLARNLASAADWLEAIIAVTDPRPSELAAIVAAIRDALSGPDGGLGVAQGVPPDHGPWCVDGRRYHQEPKL